MDFLFTGNSFGEFSGVHYRLQKEKENESI